MNVENRFNAIATDPVQRMIRVHAESLRMKRCHETSSCSDNRSCDARQCRIIVNALRREIDRLMRSIDRYDCFNSCNHNIASNNFAQSESDRCAAAGDIGHAAAIAANSRGPKLYAVAPLGKIDGLNSAACTGPAAYCAAAAGAQHVKPASSLGALLDLLS